MKSTNTPSQRLDILERRIKSMSNALQKAGINLDTDTSVVIPIELIDDTQMPQYANPTDAGIDICAREDVYIAPHQTKIVKSGIKVSIPEGYEIQVRPRSGLSVKTPLRIANSPGTIDCSYLDEVGIIVTNMPFKNNTIDGVVDTKMKPVEDYPKGLPKGTVLIRKGDRIAQLVLNRVYHAKFKAVDDVTKVASFNRGGGFGHTGV